MEKWKAPVREKVYEALGAVADGRVSVYGNTGKVFSSSGNKFYLVEYDPKTRAIMSNDNTAYWKGSVSYPMIAFFLKTGIVDYDASTAEELAGVKWKDLNTRFKGDFSKTVGTVLESKSPEVREKITREVERIYEILLTKEYFFLGSRVKPPEGY